MTEAKTITPKADGNARDHLANERTFLAWVRTSIGVMAFGFVVVKFSLFVRQLSILLHKDLTQPQSSYSSIIGIFIVAFGALLGLFSYFRFMTVQKQLDNSDFQPSKILTSILAAFVFLMGVAMVAYLIHSI
jgi:putative membrane protein